MKRLILAILLLLLAFPPGAFAALGARSMWALSTTGSDVNGGAFDIGVGSPGTDESQGSGTAITITLTGTTTGTCVPACTSTTHGPGNYVHIASGSGCSTGWFDMLSQAAGTATFDHAMGASTNVCVGVIGGPLTTFAQLATNLTIAGMGACVKADGTYSVGTGVTFSTPTASTYLLEHVYGYTSTCNYNSNDGGRVTVQASAAITLFTFSVGGYDFENFILDGNTATGTSAVSNSVGPFTMFNTTVKNWSGICLISTGAQSFSIERSELTGCAGAEGAHATNGALWVNASYIHDMAVPAFVTDTSAINSVFTNNVFANITGASSDALQIASNGNHTTILNNSFYTVGRDCVRITGNNGAAVTLLQNNVFDTCAGTAADFTAGGASTFLAPLISTNGYYNNGANRVGFAAETGAVAFTAEPFTTPGSGNFTLNSNAGGGTSAKKAGFPGQILGATGSIGYADLGALQRQDPSGSATQAGYPIQ